MRTTLIILLSFVVFHTGFSQDIMYSWDFPVKPGSERWRSLKSHQEMVNICQIPDEVVPKLTTKELVRICLDYPLLFTLTAFNNMQEGFEQNRKEFNGMQELFLRKDAGSVLIKLYSEIHPEEVVTRKSDLEKGNFKFRIFYLEIILSQNDQLSTLSKKEQIYLLIECLIKIKEKNSASYSSFLTQTTYLIMARILFLNQFKPFIEKYSLNQSKYNWFINCIMLPGKDLFVDIETTTKEYLSQTNIL